MNFMDTNHKSYGLYIHISLQEEVFAYEQQEDSGVCVPTLLASVSFKPVLIRNRNSIVLQFSSM